MLSQTFRWRCSRRSTSVWAPCSCAWGAGTASCLDSPYCGPAFSVETIRREKGGWKKCEEHFGWDDTTALPYAGDTECCSYAVPPTRKPRSYESCQIPSDNGGLSSGELVQRSHKKVTSYDKPTVHNSPVVEETERKNDQRQEADILWILMTIRTAL